MTKTTLLLALAVLAGCNAPPETYMLSSVQVAQSNASVNPPANLFTFPMPLCFLICTAHISAIREDANATGGSNLTTGAKSNSQSSQGGSGSVTNPGNSAGGNG